MNPLMMRWNVVPSYDGRFTQSPPAFHGRRPRARPTKLATVFGALSSYSLQDSAPMLVVMVAISGPVPVSPFVASARANLPSSGSAPPCWTTVPEAAGAGAGAGLAAAGELDALVVVV